MTTPACCRTGEARALQTGQVDLQREHIDIIWSKGNRSRRLPVTPQVARVLDACDQQSRARFPGRANFFVSGTGSKVSPCTAGTVFARIWDEAGLARPSDGRQPVPYDFRHHFAYACIERWRIQGKDVHAMLPYLSRYMGHASGHCRPRRSRPTGSAWNASWATSPRPSTPDASTSPSTTSTASTSKHG